MRSGFGVQQTIPLSWPIPRLGSELRLYGPMSKGLCSRSALNPEIPFFRSLNSRPAFIGARLADWPISATPCELQPNWSPDDERQRPDNGGRATAGDTHRSPISVYYENSMVIK